MTGNAKLCVSFCKVSAFRRVKSKLGVGKEDKFSYGHSVGPSGVISVDVPNYQHHAQRQQALRQTQMSYQPMPKLPTPFAAAQMPLPDEQDGAGGRMPLSRAGSISLTDHAKTIAEVTGGASGRRGSLSAQRQALVPGQASVAPVHTRLGSAPPGIKSISVSGIRPGPSLLPHHKSAPGLGMPFFLSCIVVLLKADISIEALTLASCKILSAAFSFRFEAMYRKEGNAVADLGDLPESKIAILAEGFVVERGKLAESRFHRNSRQNTPASVRPLTHTRARWDLTDK